MPRSFDELAHRHIRENYHGNSTRTDYSLYSFFSPICTYARISMSKLNEREDRSMIAHARDEGARRVLFFSDIIYSGHYLESLALFLWRVL